MTATTEKKGEKKVKAVEKFRPARKPEESGEPPVAAKPPDFPKSTKKDEKAAKPEKKAEKKAKDPPPNKVREFSRNLRVNLTDPEKLVIAGEMADERQAVKRLEKEKKDLVSSFKAKIEEHESAVDSLGTKLTNGYDLRLVDCVETKDFVAGRVIVTRKDTGEIVENRKMTIDDRQVDMFDEATEEGAQDEIVDDEET